MHWLDGVSWGALYPVPKELATDWSYHAVYGLGVAAAYAVLNR